MNTAGIISDDAVEMDDGGKDDAPSGDDKLLEGKKNYHGFILSCVRTIMLSFLLQDMISYLRVKNANVMQANEKAKVRNDEHNAMRLLLLFVYDG